MRNDLAPYVLQRRGKDQNFRMNKIFQSENTIHSKIKSISPIIFLFTDLIDARILGCVRREITKQLKHIIR